MQCIDGQFELFIHYICVWQFPCLLLSDESFETEIMWKDKKIMDANKICDHGRILYFNFYWLMYCPLVAIYILLLLLFRLLFFSFLLVFFTKLCYAMLITLRI